MNRPCRRCRQSAKTCDHHAAIYPYKPCCNKCSHQEKE